MVLGIIRYFDVPIQRTKLFLILTQSDLHCNANEVSTGCLASRIPYRHQYLLDIAPLSVANARVDLV